MINKIKRIVKKIYFLKRNMILNESKIKFFLDCDLNCSGNRIVIKKNCLFDSPTIRIRGMNNEILFEENVIIGKKCSFWLEGNNLRILVRGG